MQNTKNSGDSEKVCGNCFYGDYFKRFRGTMQPNYGPVNHVECEYYSTWKPIGEKACSNWKRRER